MASARSRLVRTDVRHLSGKSRVFSGEVKVSKVDGHEVEDPASGYRLVHDPGHPDADEQGFVKMPDVEIVNEMVDMLAASRAYEANTMAISSAKDMAKDALDI